MNTVFKKAERKQAKLKIAITGPSGSGKTYSALAIASGMGKNIALIDTENESASLYSETFDFSTLSLKPPYTITKYLEAMKAAESAGFDVLVIDSLSHAWAGDGGLLAKKEALDQRGGNSFTNWGSITKEQETFKAALLNLSVHLISTIRSKQDYVLETNDKGRSKPIKVGLAPIQRDGMEYEFTTVFDMAMDHHAQASKDRTGLFDGNLIKPSSETGQTFMNWLMKAKEVPADVGSALQATLQLKTAHNISDETLKQLAKAFKIESLKTASNEQLVDLNAYIQSNFP